MNTRGYGGRTLTKGITVYTNDKKNARIRLQVSGKVEKFATIQPKYVRMHGLVGMTPVRTVKIIPEARYPFKIVEARAVKGEDIRFELKPLNDSKSGGYEVKVENLRKTKGRYSDTIILKTDNSAKPEIQVRVYGNIMDKPREQMKPAPKKAPRSPLTQPKDENKLKEKSDQTSKADSSEARESADAATPNPKATPKTEAKPSAAPDNPDADAPAKGAAPSNKDESASAEN